jgi:hypothetical protein
LLPRNRDATRAVALLGALFMAALLAACSSGPGPLGDGGTPGQQCMGFKGFSPGAPLTTGIYELNNTGSAAATIQSVTLPDAHRLRMTKAWLVPIGRTANGGTMDAGAGFSYPPSFSKLARYQWARRLPAVGATIEPGHGFDLLFGLIWAGGKTGLSGGPVIAYTAGGSSYTVSEQVTLEIGTYC